MTNQDTDTEKLLVELERQFIDACLRADTEALDSLMAEDFIFTDPKGLNLTKSEWLADLRSGDFRFESLEVSDIRVNLNGDLASVVVTLKVKAKSRKTNYRGEYSAMDIYKRRGGNWQITLSSANQMAEE